MPENVIAFFQIIGFVASLACFLVGAYVWLRWGLCGVATVWGRRHEIDNVVKFEATDTWRRR